MQSPDPGTTPGERSSSRRVIVQHLRSLAAAGITHLPRHREAFDEVSPPAVLPSGEAVSEATRPDSQQAVEGAAKAARPSADSLRAAEGSSSLFDTGVAPPQALPREQRIAALLAVQQAVSQCTRCAELASTRTKTVFGIGDPEARLCFLGEAPGADEDRQGEPFVGRAGQLLTKIIEACRMRREDVYILNVLKCRPPNNRNPLPEEAANCRGYLDAQFEVIQPEFVCCLGAVAARMLLDTPAPIGKLRGRFYSYGRSQVLCTYHPAFLLRNPSAKKEVWEDMQLLMERMGTPIEKA